jgi:hypothetical protein
MDAKRIREEMAGMKEEIILLQHNAQIVEHLMEQGIIDPEGQIKMQ